MSVLKTIFVVPSYIRIIGKEVRIPYKIASSFSSFTLLKKQHQVRPQTSQELTSGSVGSMLQIYYRLLYCVLYMRCTNMAVLPTRLHVPMCVMYFTDKNSLVLTTVSHRRVVRASTVLPREQRLEAFHKRGYKRAPRGGLLAFSEYCTC